jgi:Na+/H+-translocating membrane pyrophosphatase
MSMTLIILGGFLMIFRALRFFAGGIAAISLVSVIARFWGGLARGAVVGNAINKGSNADSPARFADLISEHIVNVGAASFDHYESFFLAIAGAMILGPYPYGQDGSAAPLWFGCMAVITNFFGVLLLRVAVVDGKSRAQMFKQAANTPRLVIIAVTLLNIAFAPLVATQNDLGWRAYVSYVIGASAAAAISLHIGFVTNYGEDNKKELAEAPVNPAAQLFHRLGMNYRSTFFPTAVLFLAIITTMVLGQNHDANNGKEVRRSNVDYMPAIMTIGFVSIAGVMTTLQTFAAVADNALALVSTSPHSDEAGEAALATDDVGAAGAAMARAYSGAAALLVAHTIIRCFVQSVFAWYHYPIQGRKTGVIYNVPYARMEFTGMDSVYRQPSDQVFWAMDPKILPEYTINFDEKRALVGLLVGATLPFLISGFLTDGYAAAVERVSKAGNEEGDNIAVVIKDLSTGFAGKGIFPVFVTIALTCLCAFGAGPYLVVPLCFSLAVVGYLFSVTLNSNADDAAKRYVEAAEGNPDAEAAQAALIVGSQFGDVQKDTLHGAIGSLIKFVPAVLLLLAPGIVESCDKTILYESHCFNTNPRSNLVEYGF